MNDEKLTSKLMELDERDFAKVGKIKPHSQDMTARLLLLEMGVHLMDEAEMGRFRECHSRTVKLRAEETARENIVHLESLRKELADAVKKVKDRMVILTPQQKNVTVKGTKLMWSCPKCGERQEADLSKSEDDPEFLKVNGKYLSIRRRHYTSLQPITLPSGKGIPGEPGAMKISSSSMDGQRGVGIVSMPPGQSKAAVVRLAKGDIINFGFDCSKCRFRNRIVEIGVKARLKSENLESWESHQEAAS